MIWALDDAGRGARRRSSCARTTPTRCRACCGVCNEARVPVTAAAGRSGVCGASVPVFGGVLLDLTALEGIVGVDTTSMLVDVRPGTFGDVFEDDAARRARRHVRALAAVDGALDGRRLARVPRRRAAVDALRQDRGHRRGPRRRARRRHARSTPAARRAPRSAPTSRSCSSARRARSASSSAPGCARTRSRRRGARRVRVRVVRRRARRDARASCSAARRPRCCGSTTRSRPTAATRPATRNVLLDARRGRRARRRSDPPHRRRGVRAPAAISIDVALVERWMRAPQRRVRARGADLARASSSTRWRSSAPWRALPEVYEQRDRRDPRASSTRWSASAHQSHSYPDGACLYFTFAGKPPDGRARGVLPRPSWDAGQRAVLAAGGALSHHHGVGLNRSRFVADALGAGFGVLQSVKDALDPNGILNPGKLGLRSPVRRSRRGRCSEAGRGVSTNGSLVVDVGTSSVPRRRSFDAGGERCVHGVERELLPDSPADGLVEFDATAMARRLPRARARGARPRPDRSTRSASPTSAARRSCGTARPANRSGPGSAGRTCARSARASRCAPRASASAPNQSATKLQWLLDQLPDRGRAPRPLLRHGRHVGRVDAVERRACTSPTRPTRPSPACRSPTHRRSGTPHVLERARRPAGDAARRSSTPPASSARRRALPGAPPIAALRRRPAGVARRPGLRARRRRQDHVRHRRHARPRARRRPPAVRPAAAERGTFPIVAWRHDGARHVGHRGVMLAAGTNVQWLRDDLGIIATVRRVARRSRRSAPTPAASCSCPRRSGSARPAWDYGARGALVRPDARHRPRRDRARGARRASRTAAPTSSTRPKPTAASRSRRCASTAA